VDFKPACGVTGGDVLAHPIWLGDQQRPAFGWWHCPADRQARAGVILCPPLGFDYLQSYRALRVLADELATAGFCVVRFDYDGTGDSPGGGSDARLARWTATARSAIALLRRSAVADICIVGMRFGALFAASMADQDGDVDQLVLWDPCLSGQSFLAEQKALSKLAAGAQHASLDAGAVEGPGIIFGADTAADIGGLRIDQTSRPLSRRVLVLERADRPPSDALSKGDLARELLTRAEAVGQLELMDLMGAPDQELPFASVRRVVDWLSDGAGQNLRTVCLPDSGGPAVVDPGTIGHPVIETPVTVPPAGLFGILTEPNDGQSSRGTPIALMLNAGVQHHVGPSRAWVELSRRWASAGLRSLRLDLSGLGDSPFRPSNEVRHWHDYQPEAFDDVLDAVRWVRQTYSSDVILVGLCASGYQAFESGLVLRTRGVVAINPIISFVPPERREGAAVDPRRRIALPQDDIVPAFRKGGSLGRLRELHPDLAWRARVLLSPGYRSGKWLAQLVRQGTDTLIICGDREVRPIRQGLSAVGLRRLERSGLLRLEHVAGLDHALTIAAQRQSTLDMITDHVLAHFLPQQPGGLASSNGPLQTLSDTSA
jgi:alpha-beta hydrolase superfamily lysophospholipase